MKQYVSLIGLIILSSCGKELPVSNWPCLLISDNLGYPASCSHEPNASYHVPPSIDGGYVIPGTIAHVNGTATLTYDAVVCSYIPGPGQFYTLVACSNGLLKQTAHTVTVQCTSDCMAHIAYDPAKLTPI